MVGGRRAHPSTRGSPVGGHEKQGRNPWRCSPAPPPPSPHSQCRRRRRRPPLPPPGRSCTYDATVDEPHGVLVSVRPSLLELVRRGGGDQTSGSARSRATALAFPWGWPRRPWRAPSPPPTASTCATACSPLAMTQRSPWPFRSPRQQPPRGPSGRRASSLNEVHEDAHLGHPRERAHALGAPGHLRNHGRHGHHYREERTHGAELD